MVGGDIIDTNTPRTYTLKYNVSDASGNAATQVTRSVVVEDTTAPIITLTGEENITIECGSTYTDAGATANDNLDGDISTNIIVNENTLDLHTPGTYTITYDVSDAAGNAAVQITRSVTVEDTHAPTIALLGQSSISIECGATYTDAGATATDICDGDLTASIVVGGDTVDPSTPGTYTITYNVSDGAANAATQVSRSVNVEDNCSIEGEGEGEGAEPAYHAADWDKNNKINISELLRIIQFFNMNGYHCPTEGEEDYMPGRGDEQCAYHSSDYNPADWEIGLSELLRLVQFFNYGGYETHVGTEDGYTPAVK